MNKNTICTCTRLIQSLRYTKNDEWQMSRYQEKPSRINVRHTNIEWVVKWNGECLIYRRDPIAMFIIIKTKTSLHWLQTSFTYLPKDDCVIFFQVSRCKTFVVFEVLINFRNDFLYRGAEPKSLYQALLVPGRILEGQSGMTYSWSGAHRLRVPPLVTLDRLWDLWGWLQA